MSSKTFELPEIMRKETRQRVEEALDACRLYMQIGYHPGQEAPVTPAYSISPSSVTNVVKSSTESVAQRNVDEESRRRECVRVVHWALSKLSKLEREIITRSYLEDDDARDYLIRAELNMSSRTFERRKARAVYKLALTMKLEVYKEEITHESV